MARASRPGKKSANPERRPQGLCEETAQDRPSTRCSGGNGPKAENTALSWHCQEARVVGLELPNREKRAVATRRVEEGPQGPQPKRDRNRGASTPRHCLAGPARENGAPVATYQVLDPEGTLGEEAQLGNSSRCLSFTTGSDAGLSEPALQITDLAAPRSLPVAAALSRATTATILTDDLLHTPHVQMHQENY